MVSVTRTGTTHAICRRLIFSWCRIIPLGPLSPPLPSSAARRFILSINFTLEMRFSGILMQIPEIWKFSVNYPLKRNLRLIYLFIYSYLLFFSFFLYIFGLSRWQRLARRGDVLNQTKFSFRFVFPCKKPFLNGSLWRRVCSYCNSRVLGSPINLRDKL